MPRRVSDLLGSWRAQLENRNALNIWRLAPLCLMWYLWRERNARSFEDCLNGLLEMKKMILHSLYWNYHFFFFFFFFFFYDLRVIYILHVYKGCALNESTLQRL